MERVGTLTPPSPSTHTLTPMTRAVHTDALQSKWLPECKVKNQARRCRWDS